MNNNEINTNNVVSANNVTETSTNNALNVNNANNAGNESNMNNQKPKNNKTVVICMVIIIIILLGIIGFLIFNSIGKDNGNSDNNNVSNSNQNNGNINNNVSDNTNKDNQNETQNNNIINNNQNDDITNSETQNIQPKNKWKELNEYEDEDAWENYNKFVSSDKSLTKVIEKEITLNENKHTMALLYSLGGGEYWTASFACDDCYVINMYLTILFDGKVTKVNEINYKMYYDGYQNDVYLTDSNLKIIEDSENNKEYAVLLFDEDIIMYYNGINIVVFDESGNDLYKDIQNQHFSSVDRDDGPIPFYEVINNNIYVLVNSCDGDGVPYINEISFKNGKIETNKRQIEGKYEIAGGTC